MNKLELVIKESGLEKTKAEVMLNKFQDYFKIAADWENKAKSIVVTDKDQTSDMAIARVGRLELRSKRIEIEKTRKELKEQSLREGKAIDGIANVLKALIVPVEEYLGKQEKFVEIQEEKERDLKRAEIERRIEEERINKEKAEEAERERIRLENIRLKEEAEAKEKELEEERKKVEKEKLEAEQKAQAEIDRIQKEADDKAEKLRLESDKKLRLEREQKARLENEIRANRAEEERVKNEAEVKARNLRNANDSEKLEDLSKQFTENITFPKVEGDVAFKKLEQVSSMIAQIQAILN